MDWIVRCEHPDWIGFMGGTSMFELEGSEGGRRRAQGQKKIVVIGLSTEEN